MPADLSDRTDFESAERGLIARLEPGVIRNEDGQAVFEADQFGLATTGACPETVHPSLSRHSQLTALQGLYEVTPGVYQIRGADLANMTLVESRTGVVVIDPVSSQECAAAAFALYRAHRGDRPVTAMIYTHPHLDHFGGVLGVVPPDTKVPIIAPEHFMQHAVAEKIYAGTAMLRRGMYYSGDALPVGPAGSGYRYEVSVLQAEFSLTQVLDKPVSGRIFFEQLIRDNLDIGRACLRSAHHPQGTAGHARPVPHPRPHRRRHPHPAYRLQALRDQTVFQGGQSTQDGNHGQRPAQSAHVRGNVCEVAPEVHRSASRASWMVSAAYGRTPRGPCQGPRRRASDRGCQPGLSGGLRAGPGGHAGRVHDPDHVSVRGRGAPCLCVCRDDDVRVAGAELFAMVQAALQRLPGGRVQGTG